MCLCTKMNIYSCWLPSIYDAKEHLFAFHSRSECSRSRSEEQRRVHRCECVGGEGRVALLQTESVGFTFLYVRMENWVHLMLQNEYLRNWTFRRSINNIEFQTYKKPEAEKSRRKIYLSDSRKAGKFICLLRPSNGWLHLKVDWSGRMKVNIKGLPKTIIGIICIRNCPLPPETVMLRRVGIKILGRIRIKLSFSPLESFAFQPHASTRKSP